MKAEVYRDNAGFWMARIEEDVNTPENRGIWHRVSPPDVTGSALGEQGGSRSGLAPRNEP